MLIQNPSNGCSKKSEPQENTFQNNSNMQNQGTIKDKLL